MAPPMVCMASAANWSKALLLAPRLLAKARPPLPGVLPLIPLLLLLLVRLVPLPLPLPLRMLARPVESKENRVTLLL